MNYKKITFIFCLAIFLSAGRNANAQTNDTTFNYTGAVQTWVVPPCVLSVTYDVAGAQGGTNGALGGLGARMTGVITVTPGHSLSIFVGGKGGSTYEAASGGGGSGIVDVSTPLVVAGAGGGASSIDGYAGKPGLTGTSGGSSSGPGGTAGNGGEKGYTSGDCGWSGGGGGFLTGGTGGNGSWDGGALPGTVNGIGAGASALNGGAGANDGGCNGGGAAGGWGCGGGGSGNYGGGGGGGYSGGGGGQYTPTPSNSPGGGGGSYTIGTDTVNTSGFQSGNGYVKMSWVYSHVSLTDTAVVVKNVDCHGNSDGVAAASKPGIGVKYLWSPGGKTTDTAKGLSAGTYTLAISDACGDTVRGAITITQPNILTGATAVATENILCNGGNNGIATVSSIAGGGSPFTYSWSDPNLQTTKSATTLTAGSYTVTITDVCGATTSTSVTITQPNALTVAASATNNVDCNGNNNGTASSTVTNGTVPYTYSWSDANSQTTPVATGLSPGTYTLNVVDKNGCTGSARVTITQPNALTVSAATTSDIKCNGSATGGASSTVNGGTAPFTYAWTAGGGNGANASTLRAGIDTVMVVDAHGCSASASTLVTEPAAVQVLRRSTVDHGNCQASAWVVVSGGVAPYTYAWSNNGNTTYFIGSLCHGSYCCTVTDANGCADSVCISVTTDLGVGNINGNAGQITVYPNPNSGQFTIEAGATNGASSVEIYNVLGEKVYTTSIAANKGGATVVNISNQPNGIYLYRVISNDNGSLLGEGKVILQK